MFVKNRGEIIISISIFLQYWNLQPYMFHLKITKYVLEATASQKFYNLRYVEFDIL